MKTDLNSIVCIYFFFILLVPFHSFSQIYSKGITKDGKKVSSHEPVTVETDPILKMAKTNAPFDRPFFIKIKRAKQAKNPSTTISQTIEEGEKSKYKIEIKQDVSGTNLTSPNFISTQSSKVKSVKILNIQAPAVIIDILKQGESQLGVISEESKNSDFLMIKIDNLKPEQSYMLIVSWEDSLEPIVDDNYIFNTIPSSVEIRNKNRISSQIGGMLPYFKREGSNYTPFSLMLGFYLKIFRPKEPQIRSIYYKPFALQRFSAFCGVTINKMADGYIRQDLIGSSNLMLGVGYQISDVIRITGGEMLFTEIDPNRLMSNRKSLASTFYVGMTVDIQIKDLLGGIVTTLGLK